MASYGSAGKSENDEENAGPEPAEEARGPAYPGQYPSMPDDEIGRRKAALRFTEEDAALLAALGPIARQEVDTLANRFYEEQLSIPEIAAVIREPETLHRLHLTMRAYILDMFSGVYDAAYVGKRLHIGNIHKRIGVGPELYLASVHRLKSILDDMIERHSPGERGSSGLLRRRLEALDKLLSFDSALIFDTYIGSLMLELRSNYDQLEALSRTDALTGLLNRRIFDETLRREIKIADRSGTPISLVIVDLDGFKALNDQAGHAEGDRVLRQVGETLLRTLREGEGAFRLGGDEFAIIMPRTQAEQAGAACHRIQAELRKVCDPRIRFSIGIADAWPDSVLTPDALFRRADSAMYDAKRSGGNLVRVVLAMAPATSYGWSIDKPAMN